MKRLLVALVTVLVVVGPMSPADACAQSRATPARIAYVYLYPNGPSAPFTDAFRTRLRELGWIEGRNILIEFRDARGSQQNLAAIMEELVRARVDVIVGPCTPEGKAAQKATSTIPIVVAASGDPVQAGLAASLSHPGGNVTGLSAFVLDLSAKRIELLKQAVPTLSRAVVLWNPVRPDNAPEVKVMQMAAQSVGVQLRSLEVRSPDDITNAFEILSRERPQALTNAGDTLLSSESERIVAFAAKMRIPAIYENREYVDAGGLMSYGPNFPMLHRRAADYVDRILKGAKPADLPMEQPTKFEFVINLKTAKTLGLTIPPSLLLRADHVIE